MKMVAALARIDPPCPIRIADVEIYAGPSPHSPEPVVVTTVHTVPLHLSAAELRDRLAARFPNLDLPLLGNGPIPPMPLSSQDSQQGWAPVCWGASHGSSAAAEAARMKPAPQSFWIEYLSGPTAIQAVRTTLVAIGAAISDMSGSDPYGEVERLDQACVRYRPICSPTS